MVRISPDSSPQDVSDQTTSTAIANVTEKKLNGHDINGNGIHGKTIHIIDRSKVTINKVLGKYERDISMAPAKIPLSDTYTNVEQFQIRSTPYSEESVQKIICAIKKGNFIKELFNPNVLWYNEEEGKLYVLAGHSRREAFRRLSDPAYIDPETNKPLCEHPGVMKFTQETGIDFTRIWAHVVDNNTLNDAKRIAAISNTLGTPESLVDRAYYYKTERECKKTDDRALEKEYKILEGRNWNTVLSLSYLNVTGNALQSLCSFSGNEDVYKDLLKVCKWVGEARRKHVRLSNVHEDELFDWLYNGMKNGFGGAKISTQTAFMKTLADHITKLQKKGGLRADRRLNISGKKKYSFALQQYDNALAAYNRQIRKEAVAEEKIKKQIVDINVMKNKGAVDAEIERTLLALQENLNQKRVDVIQMRVNLQLAQNLRFEYKISDKDKLQLSLEMFSNIYVKKEAHKKNRKAYIEAEKAQTNLFFQLDGGDEGAENDEIVEEEAQLQENVIN